MTNPLSFFDVADNATTTGPLDLGTVGPASSDDTQLRVYNASSAYQADDVVVTTTGTNHLELWLSSDGYNFGAQVDLGDIPPGGYSALFWMRRITDHFAATSTRTASLQATPTGWSLPNSSGSSDNIPLETED